MIKDFRIFIDLDGVLANWYKAMFDTMGMNINSHSSFRDALKSGKMLDEINGFDEDDMWDKINSIGPSWWENIEILPWAKELHDAMQELGDVAFLTSPSKNAQSAAISSYGKFLWVDKHFGEMKNCIITWAKHFCANNNTILIDDSSKKVAMFLDYGGFAYKWPNQLRIADGEADVQEHIASIANLINIAKKV